MLSPKDGHRADSGATSEVTSDTPIKRPSCQEVSSLLREVDLAAIADQFELGTHTWNHDFEPDRKVSILEGIDRQVVAVDTTHIALDVLVTVTVDGDGAFVEVRPDNGGLKLRLAARVDGEGKQPLTATVTHPNTNGSTQVDALETSLAGFPDLEEAIQVYDRGFIDYERFSERKHNDRDFVAVLKANTRTTDVNRLQAVEVRDEKRVLELY